MSKNCLGCSEMPLKLYILEGINFSTKSFWCMDVFQQNHLGEGINFSTAKDQIAHPPPQTAVNY